MGRVFIGSFALSWDGNSLSLHLAGLAVSYEFLVVLILISAQFVAPGSDQMDM